ncbi:HDIG domain-containing protein [Aneurinibacillus sp. Ricciae_BoGa-3]|uniref:HD family phosphohydrolase n=1 Tax=Aneurinibacillus sp. Ricciae_BoGa-3 TaxID=3022697 RepID=UPI0023400B7A|nr:HDIG domain-containing metalloprotein [Aneurinibacillus sp. Ricciae_BoGa-3]WCK53466.1 HDIG domain-containing protein [Aneurinibacillus sp. Ricciae_BoGa-3]
MFAKKRLHLNVPESWKRSVAVRRILFLLIGIGIYLPLMGNVLPKTFDLNVNTISNVTLTAPVTVEDAEATESARQKAVAEVQPVYSRDDSITANQLKLTEFVYKKAVELTADGSLTPAQRLQELKDNAPISLPQDVLQTLLTLSKSELEAANKETSRVVSAIMVRGVDQTTSRDAVQQRVNQQIVLSDMDSKARKVVRAAAIASIIPNLTIDEQATKDLKESVRRMVKPTMIYKGEVLVEKGQYVSEEIHRKLSAAGLLANNASKFPFIGLGIITAFTVGFLAVYLARHYRHIYENNSMLLMLGFIIFLNTIVMKIASYSHFIDFVVGGYLAPVALGAMLTAILLNTQIAVIVSVIFSMIAGVIFNYGSLLPFDFRFSLFALMSSLVATYSLGKAIKRSRIMRAGFLVSLGNLLIISAIFLLMYTTGNWRDLLLLYGFGAASGIAAAVLTVGFLPFFEGFFGMLSPLRLIELGNPNQPLLRRLLMETPGTYHHSMMVGSLSEAACEAIGANGLLARVGSYYHDVGKMKRPQFFIENQMNRENPHDSLAPGLSKRIIIAHAYDGSKMLEEHNMPRAIRDIAEQHHGTTLLKYFFHKACKLSDTPIPESDYRYPGPKPQTREAAVVSVCDSAEAAVRSLSKPTPDRIEQIVRRIIAERIEDGQFNECNITMQELEIVAKTICETLQGFFHNRIEYPDDKQMAVKQA